MKLKQDENQEEKNSVFGFIFELLTINNRPKYHRARVNLLTELKYYRLAQAAGYTVIIKSYDKWAAVYLILQTMTFGNVNHPA